MGRGDTPRFRGNPEIPQENFRKSDIESTKKAIEQIRIAAGWLVRGDVLKTYQHMMELKNNNLPLFTEISKISLQNKLPGKPKKSEFDAVKFLPKHLRHEFKVFCEGDGQNPGKHPHASLENFTAKFNASLNQRDMEKTNLFGLYDSLSALLLALEDFERYLYPHLPVRTELKKFKERERQKNNFSN